MKIINLFKLTEVIEMNEIINNMLTRRSARAYKPEQISDSDLNLILEAATYAPSGMNTQTWHFTAVQNQEKLQKLNEIVKTAILNLPDNPNMPSLAGFKKNAENPKYSFFYNAPTLVITSNAKTPIAALDNSAALQNIFLAANSLNINSCWIHTLVMLCDIKEVRSFLTELGIPQDNAVYGSAALGFNAAGELKAPPRKDGTVNIVK
jgi:nitroreductase